MENLWNKEREKEFFRESLNKFSTPEQLFYYTEDDRFVAYWPKGYDGEKTTLQSRNSLIGNFTEKFVVDLLQNYAHENGWYAVQGVICDDLGLSPRSPADVGFCDTKERRQRPENIHALFEVKMSLVWNWEYFPDKPEENLVCFGDYKSHTGNPGLLRSDSMLKAIGKSINIRVSGLKGAHIPVIILGNSPITKNHSKKVDFLKKAGIIQSFISLYPNSTNGFIRNTDGKGFQTFNEYQNLINYITEVISSDMNFFSSMLPKRKLGQIITVSAKEKDGVSKAEKFFKLAA